MEVVIALDDKPIDVVGRYVAVIDVVATIDRKQ